MSSSSIALATDPKNSGLRGVRALERPSCVASSAPTTVAIPNSNAAVAQVATMRQPHKSLRLLVTHALSRSAYSRAGHRRRELRNGWQKSHRNISDGRASLGCGSGTSPSNSESWRRSDCCWQTLTMSPSSYSSSFSGRVTSAGQMFW